MFSLSLEQETRVHVGVRATFHPLSLPRPPVLAPDQRHASARPHRASHRRESTPRHLLVDCSNPLWIHRSLAIPSRLKPRARLRAPTHTGTRGTRARTQPRGSSRRPPMRWSRRACQPFHREPFQPRTRAHPLSIRSRRSRPLVLHCKRRRVLRPCVRLQTPRAAPRATAPRGGYPPPCRTACELCTCRRSSSPTRVLTRVFRRMHVNSQRS